MKKILWLFVITFALASCKKVPNENVAVKPEITGIAPASGVSGDIITITGKNFGASSIVYFGTTQATINSKFATEIKAVVPEGTGSVQIFVQIGGDKSNTASFTYIANTQLTPALQSLQYASAVTGDTIRISGNNFNANSKVLFANLQASVVSASATNIVAIIPFGSGNTKVSVQNDYSGIIKTSNQLDFSYSQPINNNFGTINFGGVSYSIDTTAYYKIGPGTYFLALSLTEPSNTSPLKVFLTTIDGTNQYINIKPVVGRDSVSNTERPSSMAARKSTAGNRYIAGTNSDYWDDNGYQRNVNMIDGVLASMGDNRSFGAGNYRGNAIFDQQKRMYIDNLIYSASATFGTKSIIIDTINYYQYTNPDNLIFFNIYCGKTTGTNNARTEVAVTPVSGTWNYLGETNVKVVELYPNKGNNAVSNTISILSGATGAAADFLNQLKKDDVLKVNFSLAPRGGGSFAPYNVTGGWQIIMRNSVITQDFPSNGTTLHPRTGIGFSNNGTKVYMCAIDGRSAASAGVFTSGLAEIMRYFGATDALNLDGGGSTTMYLDKIGTMNVPSDGSERAVASGIFAVSSAPDDNTIAEIVPARYIVRLPKGGSLAPVFYGLNKYGQIVSTNLSGVTLQGNGLGSISGGNFVAGSQTGYGYVTATYNNLAARIKVFVE